MIAYFLTAVAIAASAEPAIALATKDGLIREATEQMLNGERLSPDMSIKLMSLGPADRIEVIIFLRRSGMLEGAGWDVDRLLAPAVTGDVPQ